MPSWQQPSLQRPLTLAVVLIFLSKRYINKNLSIRKRVTSNPFWKTQFLLHPLIIFCLVRKASSVSSYDNAATDTYALLMVPFAFNFGVEPFDISSDLAFLLFFYMHHFAAVMACLPWVPSDNDRQDGSTNSFGLAQALLLAHAWTLHPIGYLAHRKFLIRDKQQVFTPYIASGFILMLGWWTQWINLASFDDNSAAAATTNALPIVLQYLGRWGLYLRMCSLEGWHRPTNANYDPFEWNKQWFEIASFGLSYLVVIARNYLLSG